MQSSVASAVSLPDTADAGKGIRAIMIGAGKESEAFHVFAVDCSSAGGGVLDLHHCQQPGDARAAESGSRSQDMIKSTDSAWNLA